jgi:hypothetical protein
VQAIGNIIQFKTAPGLNRSLEAAVILARLNEIANNEWQATQFRKGILTITTPNPTQAQQLVLNKELLRKQFNELLSAEVIERLVIRTAPRA